MAAQYVTPSEFERALNSFFAKITRYIDGRIEATTAQILDDRMKDKEETTTFQNEIKEQLTNLEERQTKTEATLADVVAHQKALLETFQATTSTITKSIADSHASLSEQINELRKQMGGN
jgi:uncharacterized coiled-coil protein SlyX